MNRNRLLRVVTVGVLSAVLAVLLCSAVVLAQGGKEVTIGYWVWGAGSEVVNGLYSLPDTLEELELSVREESPSYSQLGEGATCSIDYSPSNGSEALWGISCGRKSLALLGGTATYSYTVASDDPLEPPMEGWVVDKGAPPAPYLTKFEIKNSTKITFGVMTEETALEQVGEFCGPLPEELDAEYFVDLDLDLQSGFNSVPITLTNLPEGVSCWKCNKDTGNWDDLGSSFTLVDGGPYDYDGNSGNGKIDDPAILGTYSGKIPTLSEWGLIAFVGMLGAYAVRRMKRR